MYIYKYIQSRTVLQQHVSIISAIIIIVSYNKNIITTQ